MMKINKKGQVLQNLGALGVGVVTIAFILAITFLIMGSVKTQTVTMGSQCADLSNTWNTTSETCCNVTQGPSCSVDGVNVTKATSQAWNSTRTLTNATATIPGWIPLIILVAIGGLILGLISLFGKNK